MMYAPDISQTPFQAMLGLGTLDHNKRLIVTRSAHRPDRPVQTAYWNIWKVYQKRILDSFKKQRKGNET